MRARRRASRARPALTATSAPTTKPPEVIALAEPSPPLRPHIVGAVAGAGGAEREFRAGVRRRREAQVAIRRAAAPGLVAAVVEIEQRRAGDDRHAPAPTVEAAPVVRRGRPSRRPRIEAEGRAAGKHEGVDASDRHLAARAAPRRAAPARRQASRARRGRRLVEDDDADARGEPRVVRRADAQAGNVGDEIVHGRPLRARETAVCQTVPVRLPQRKRRRPFPSA